MSEDKRVFIKSVSSSSDSDKIRFFMHTSDGREFSCWLDKFHFSVCIKDAKFHESMFMVETTDISVLQHAVFLVANGHFKKSLEDSWNNPITEEMINIVDNAIDIENKRHENK